MILYNCSSILIKLSGVSILYKYLKIADLLTVSKAFLYSIKQAYKGFFNLCIYLCKIVFKTKQVC